MIQRHSSREGSLAQFLPDVLHGAVRYDRIAGYFRSSILGITAESIASMGENGVARIVCNSDLDLFDVQTARAAHQAMLQEWKASLPEVITDEYKGRLRHLFQLLVSKRLQVKVLPKEQFGLLHGKAGIVQHADGSRLSFVGSANETASGWRHNYEIVWADRSEEGCDWVQAEFDGLWNHASAIDLAQVVIEDIGRVAQRTVVPSLEAWRTADDPAAIASIETPVYMKEGGLWAHQKWFVHHAFELHKHHGARLVLADQVGLGKTLQLALAAKLMLLHGNGNVLVVVPKPLMQQWRDELWDMLRLPSAIWTGRHWEDEHGMKHPAVAKGHYGLAECPRRLGIVSGGLVKQSELVRQILSDRSWVCVILDEAHHARRSNTGESKKHESAVDNNMLKFLRSIAGSTHSMLLATATPVQMDVIEAFDLLDVLNQGNWRVLGTEWSRWRREPRVGLSYVSGKQAPPEESHEIWEWMRNPFPQPLGAQGMTPAQTRKLQSDIEDVQKSLGTPVRVAEYSSEAINALRPIDRRKLTKSLASIYFDDLNPYISHIVRRRREFLEQAINPDTNEPYLPKVEVELFGDRSPIHAPAELQSAFEAAEAFCKEVGKRPNMTAGFLQTLLLRRVGSSVISGRSTAEKMLGPEGDIDLLMEEDDTIGGLEDAPSEDPESKLYPLTDTESRLLRDFLNQLGKVGTDPKYQLILDVLRTGTQHGAVRTEPWLDLGCIIFSQYYDSARWLGDELTKEFPNHLIAVYAGAGRSGIWQNGQFESTDRDTIKHMVREGTIRLLIGTDAASEGLNLQKLGTLINLDLPWNPTRLEQRKGRIQRIGQVRDTVYVYNMRYRGSVEDRVHEKLSRRLENIQGIFGQLPDTLEDVWVSVARNEEAHALQLIESFQQEHPFVDKYDRIQPINWESCSVVLDKQVQLDHLLKGWDGKPR